MTAPAKHARISISKLAQIDACEASLQMQESVPPLPESEESIEGTAWHMVAAAHLSGNPWPVGAHFESGGRRWEVTPDMWAGAMAWAKCMGGAVGHMRVEDPVRATRIHDTECWGTPDGWQLLRDGLPWSGGLPVLRVGDYKAGHRYVEVFEHQQLIGYGVGVLERLELPDTDIWFEFIVCQPRSFHRRGPVRVWRVKASDLRPIVNRLHAKAAAALAPDPTARTGPHCMDCTASHVCETLLYNVNHVIEYAGKMQSAALTPQAMGLELRMLREAMKLLEAREIAVAASVESVIRAGAPVPGWKMEAGRSAFKWNPDTTPEDLGVFGDLLGMELRKPLATITPTQAIDAGMDEATTLQFATRLPGAMKLKLDNAADARRVFAYELPNETK